MSRKDIFITILVGIFTGLIWTGIFVRLGTFDGFGVGGAVWGLVVVVPIIFVFGLYLGRWLSKFASFFSSFAKFVMVGFFNAGIDLGIFNLLMFLTGIERGISVSSFKAAAFLAALINSYYWNKHWAFKASETKEGTREFSKFAMVSVGGLVANVGATTLIILIFIPQFGFAQLSWNNLAAVVGNIAGLIWNFIGYRFIVFKSNGRVTSNGQSEQQ
ncbi:MAG: GtrA family protein [Patescibacteria group bacterium]